MTTSSGSSFFWLMHVTPDHKVKPIEPVQYTKSHQKVPFVDPCRAGFIFQTCQLVKHAPLPTFQFELTPLLSGGLIACMRGHWHIVFVCNFVLMGQELTHK